MSKPKHKRKHTPRSASLPPIPTKNSGGEVVTGADYPTEEIKWWREAIEGLVIAIVLALLIRGFEAEAFVIPTGSMAPTLRGIHKDVKCPECSYEYAAGASMETVIREGRIVGTSCPCCRAPKDIEYTEGRDASFAGDRILVNKFAYDLMGDPERFDVIVFKNPNNAKQNYIKRLVGLPGETLLIQHGDVYTRKVGDNTFGIARKPPKKLRSMLQLIHDTSFIPPFLDKAGVPPRWQAAPQSNAWSTADQNRSFELASSADEQWIRYRHITPTTLEWGKLRNGEDDPFTGGNGQLIDDFYAYNTQLGEYVSSGRRNEHEYMNRSVGKNWVGDLAVECEVQVKGNTGELILDLSEGGWDLQCKIDVSTGTAEMSINGGKQAFDAAPIIQAQTPVKGTGTYRMMFSNVDDELRLWVNDKVVQFDHAGTYLRDATLVRPTYRGPSDPCDLAPVGIGGKGLAATVNRIRIFRDKYYIAVNSSRRDTTMGDSGMLSRGDATKIFRSPESWSTTDVFNLMSAQFELNDFDDDAMDQFFPMGDNSPQSLDARIWHDGTPGLGNYVERQFLIGEAVLIYYPHPWHIKNPVGEGTLPILVWPKFSRMGLIK